MAVATPSGTNSKCDEYRTWARLRKASDTQERTAVELTGLKTGFLEISNLTFTYPEQRTPALDELDLVIEQGEFVVLCGPSGCGKTTLLRHFKTVMMPHGSRTGCVFYRNRPLDELDQREQSESIGFVMQDPDNQVVTDKVWHELAFGLESLGCNTPTIRRRVAEMASFFGIQTWFYKNVTELSGGQKQLLNLASIMAMQPSVLILDEPTSQLDPIAASEFLATIGRINRELGTTVILTEHRLEDAFPLASRVAVLNEGRLLCTGTPYEVGADLKGANHAMFLAMPTAMRIWAAVDNDLTCPITVREGRNWLTSFSNEQPLDPIPEEAVHTYQNETVISAEDLWYKYEPDLPDVIRGLSLNVKKGEFIALLGGNGTGKTTSLKLIAGLLKSDRGEVKTNGNIGILPQNPQTLFVKNTVREDLTEILKRKKLSVSIRDAKIKYVVRLCRLDTLLDRHPYDLSGGEQQRVALAKVLLLDPEVLFMDEPTKGLDAEFKQIFAEILRMLLSRSVTILMVSHDVEFCARYAHVCAMFSDGSIAAAAPPRAFFSGNSFYTTSANRIARRLQPEAITADDVIAMCGGDVQSAPELIIDETPLPPPEETSTIWKPPSLTWWRKLLGVISAATVIFCFIQALGVSDLSTLVSSEGLTTLVGSQVRLYVLLLGALAVFALAIGRRSPPPVMVQTPKENRKLNKRSAAAAVVVLLVPLTLFIGVYYLDGKKYYFMALMVMLECMLPFFFVFEGRKPQARELVILAVLCAIGVAGRAAFFMLPNFKPVMALVIISGVAFGAEAGFLVGAITMLSSNMLFSQGPWTPWQMFAMGIIGFLAGILFRKGFLRRNRGALCIFGALATIVIYGGIMNPASALMWSAEINWKIIFTYYITGFPVDCVHAAATVVFLWFAAEPMLEKLDRIKVKYGLVE